MTPPASKTASVAVEESASHSEDGAEVRLVGGESAGLLAAGRGGRDGAIVRMTNHSGSFPLMAIAAEHGVEYGDVLLMADLYRCTVQRLHVPRGRAVLASRAAYRVQKAGGVRALVSLRTTLVRHALGRWS